MEKSRRKPRLYNCPVIHTFEEALDCDECLEIFLREKF